MAGVSIAVFGLSISIIGQTIAQVGSTDFGPGVFLGALVAAIGAVVSLISALVLEESRYKHLTTSHFQCILCLRRGSDPSNSRYSQASAQLFESRPTHKGRSISRTASS